MSAVLDPTGVGAITDNDTDTGADAPADTVTTADTVTSAQGHVAERRSRWTPSAGLVAGAVVVVAAWCIGLGPLSDNSFLTHLATGRRLLSGGLVHRDPYTFTAGGQGWTVQSWLASLWYALAEDWFGMRGIQIFTALLSAGIGAALWRLTRPALTVTARALLVVPVLISASGYWSERPLLIGLGALTLVLITVDGGLDPRWLIPVMWVWVNVHGSFPFALVAVAVLALGRRLDGQSAERELTTLRWVAIGTVLGGLNPLGPRLLVFPFELLRRSSHLQHIAEWKAPSFTESWQRGFLLQLVVMLLVLGHRRSWRLALVVALFGSMALVSMRNIAVASLVMAAASAPVAAGIGPVVSGYRRSTFKVALLGLAFVVAVTSVSAFSQPPQRLEAYPVAALAWWDVTHGLDAQTRLAAPDMAGNYLEAAFGGKVPVFFDDRAELFDQAFVSDVLALYEAKASARQALARLQDRYGLQGVLWYRDSPFGQWLIEAPEYRLVFSDQRWIIVEPR
jgi:hypothetical protein